MDSQTDKAAMQIRGVRKSFGEGAARLYRLALVTGPGAEPALPRSGAEISVVVDVGQPFHPALRANLAVAVIPVEYNGRAGIVLKFTALAGAVIREKSNLAERGVDFLAQYHPGGWSGVRVDGREHHRIRIRLRGVAHGLREPVGGDLQRVVGQRVR